MSKRIESGMSGMDVFSTPSWRHQAVFNSLTRGMNRLRAQLFNSAELLPLTSEQSKALKGLISQFTFEFWSIQAREIDDAFLGIKDNPNEPTASLGPTEQLLKEPKLELHGS